MIQDYIDGSLWKLKVKKSTREVFWKKKWCFCDGNSFYYWEGNKKPSIDELPAKVINLEYCDIVMNDLFIDDSDLNNLSFRILDKINSVEFIFATPSEDEYKIWYATLKGVKFNIQSYNYERKRTLNSIGQGNVETKSPNVIVDEVVDDTYSNVDVNTTNEYQDNTYQASEYQENEFQDNGYQDNEYQEGNNDESQEKSVEFNDDPMNKIDYYEDDNDESISAYNEEKEPDVSYFEGRILKFKKGGFLVSSKWVLKWVFIDSKQLLQYSDDLKPNPDNLHPSHEFDLQISTIEMCDHIRKYSFRITNHINSKYCLYACQTEQEFKQITKLFNISITNERLSLNAFRLSSSKFTEDKSCLSPRSDNTTQSFLFHVPDFKPLLEDIILEYFEVHYNTDVNSSSYIIPSLSDAKDINDTYFIKYTDLRGLLETINMQGEFYINPNSASVIFNDIGLTTDSPLHLKLFKSWWVSFTDEYKYTGHFNFIEGQNFLQPYKYMSSVFSLSHYNGEKLHQDIMKALIKLPILPVYDVPIFPLTKPALSEDWNSCFQMAIDAMFGFSDSYWNSTKDTYPIIHLISHSNNMNSTGNGEEVMKYRRRQFYPQNYEISNKGEEDIAWAPSSIQSPEDPSEFNSNSKLVSDNILNYYSLLGSFYRSAMNGTQRILDEYLLPEYAKSSDIFCIPVETFSNNMSMDAYVPVVFGYDGLIFRIVDILKSENYIKPLDSSDSTHFYDSGTSSQNRKLILAEFLGHEILTEANFQLIDRYLNCYSNNAKKDASQQVLKASMLLTTVVDYNGYRVHVIAPVNLHENETLIYGYSHHNILNLDGITRNFIDNVEPSEITYIQNLFKQLAAELNIEPFICNSDIEESKILLSKDIQLHVCNNYFSNPENSDKLVNDIPHDGSVDEEKRRSEYMNDENKIESNVIELDSSKPSLRYYLLNTMSFLYQMSQSIKINDIAETTHENRYRLEFIQSLKPLNSGIFDMKIEDDCKVNGILEEPNVLENKKENSDLDGSDATSDTTSTTSDSSDISSSIGSIQSGLNGTKKRGISSTIETDRIFAIEFNTQSNFDTLNNESLQNKPSDLVKLDVSIKESYALRIRYLAVLLDFQCDYPHDSFSFTRLIHEFGINCRSLGRLYFECRQKLSKDLILTEITARSFKNILNQKLSLHLQNSRLILRELKLKYAADGQTIESTELIKFNEAYMDKRKLLIVEMFNLILGSTEQSRSFWKESLRETIKQKYEIEISDDYSVNYPKLHSALQYHTSTVFVDKIIQFSQSRSIESELNANSMPLVSADDILVFHQPLVKWSKKILQIPMPISLDDYQPDTDHITAVQSSINVNPFINRYRCNADLAEYFKHFGFYENACSIYHLQLSALHTSVISSVTSTDQAFSQESNDMSAESRFKISFKSKALLLDTEYKYIEALYLDCRYTAALEAIIIFLEENIRYQVMTARLLGLAMCLHYEIGNYGNSLDCYLDSIEIFDYILGPDHGIQIRLTLKLADLFLNIDTSRKYLTYPDKETVETVIRLITTAYETINIDSNQATLFINTLSKIKLGNRIGKIYLMELLYQEAAEELTQVQSDFIKYQKCIDKTTDSDLIACSILQNNKVNLSEFIASQSGSYDLRSFYLNHLNELRNEKLTCLFNLSICLYRMKNLDKSFESALMYLEVSATIEIDNFSDFSVKDFYSKFLIETFTLKRLLADICNRKGKTDKAVLLLREIWSDLTCNAYHYDNVSYLMSEVSYQMAAIMHSSQPVHIRKYLEAIAKKFITMKSNHTNIDIVGVLPNEIDIDHELWNETTDIVMKAIWSDKMKHYYTLLTNSLKKYTSDGYIDERRVSREVLSHIYQVAVLVKMCLKFNEVGIESSSI